jgi:2-phospho-L-lactate guanylyltransferase
MTLKLILPVRLPNEGKQRLASVLGPEAREALNRAFFDRTLTIACTAVAPADVLVVSRSTELLALAAARGTRPLLEEGDGGLNAALTQAAALVGRAHAALSLSTDLPLLEPADVEAMIAAAADRDVVLAADRAGTGTNALLVTPPGAIPYCYGPGSAAAHRQAATGLRFACIDRLGLACDVDTPDDLVMHSAAIAALLQGNWSRVA